MVHVQTPLEQALDATVPEMASPASAEISGVLCAQ